MPPSADPVTSPVTFPFENGAIRLITVIDPVSGQHSVVCDLCDKSISLDNQAASKPLFNHRGSDLCHRSAFKRLKKGKRANIGELNYVTIVPYQLFIRLHWFTRGQKTCQYNL
jgi:hypothetical protein